MDDKSSTARDPDPKTTDVRTETVRASPQITAQVQPGYCVSIRKIMNENMEDIMSIPRIHASVISLQMRGIPPDKIVYQWKGNNNKDYGPVFEDAILARDYPTTVGLKPHEPPKIL